jgi:hypothetical protein
VGWTWRLPTPPCELVASPALGAALRGVISIISPPGRLDWTLVIDNPDDLTSSPAIKHAFRRDGETTRFTVGVGLFASLSFPAGGERLVENDSPVPSPSTPSGWTATRPPGSLVEAPVPCRSNAARPSGSPPPRRQLPLES